MNFSKITHILVICILITSCGKNEITDFDRMLDGSKWRAVVPDSEIMAASNVDAVDIVKYNHKKISLHGQNEALSPEKFWIKCEANGAKLPLINFLSLRISVENHNNFELGSKIIIDNNSIRIYDTRTDQYMKSVGLPQLAFVIHKNGDVDIRNKIKPTIEDACYGNPRIVYIKTS